MAPPKKAAVQAEVVLLPQLKSCLVNLPPSLVSALVNTSTLAQNVIVELSYKADLSPAPSTTQNGADAARAAYMGWTGMQSRRKTGAIVGREGLAGTRGSASADRDIPVVEMDPVFARLLGIREGHKVGIILHVDPPQAHTVNVEPLTPADWEIIELHGRFLEDNFMSQIRALPNPAFTSKGTLTQYNHPISLHLSPTSTANVIVTSLEPKPDASYPFVKISPNSEVIVAPKTRQRRQSRSASREDRSVASTSRKSTGGKSSASTVRRKSHDANRSQACFFRGVDRKVATEWFDEPDQETGLRVWLAREVLVSRAFRNVKWVVVSVVKPSGLQEPVNPQDNEGEKYASKVVAKLCEWEDAPDANHAALSTSLCATLAAEGLVGDLVKLEVAPQQAKKYSSVAGSEGASQQTVKEISTKNIKIRPFSTGNAQQKDGFRFGGESKNEREEATRRFKELFGAKLSEESFLDGPLTSGMVVPSLAYDKHSGWNGGILNFDPLPASSITGAKQEVHWVLGSESKLTIEVEGEVAKPTSLSKPRTAGDALPEAVPTMAGVDSLLEQVSSHLTHSSSILLIGGLGSGKTTLTQLLAHRLRCESLHHITHYSCKKLTTDETRISTIKETITRIFATAAWAASSGGRALVILDDLDKLCPVETELQVGNENSRSRHVSETIVAIAKQYCFGASGVVLLATAQAKEALNNVIIGGHVVREIIALKAPNKNGRREVLEMLLQPNIRKGAPSLHEAATNHEGSAWLDGPEGSRPGSSSSTDGFEIDPNIDLLEVAGQTDGYMPGDLVLLASRARSEALIRSTQDVHSSSGTVRLTQADFDQALKGFTPASLRNVTLQSSTTKWESIGGLKETRQVLLETLQYPTTYAPIFAKCPLRLRSGLLLYGYPGCGKTLLASAVAGECGLNFISVKGPEILNKYIGASEKSVRDLFERAEAARPCVLFFDEFDSIAPKRGHDSTGVTDRVVNQMLTQMDGAEGLSGVYVLAATSRPDLIDPALLRPGRLDKSLLCDLPNLEDRLDILRALSIKLKISDEVTTKAPNGRNLYELARRTEGYSGADLQAVVYNAHLEAIHDILGDHATNGDADPSKRTSTLAKATDKAKSASLPSKTPNFTHFRYGDSNNLTTPTSSSALTENATIAAKIAQLQVARRRQKELMHPELRHKDSSHADSDGASDTTSSEPVIHWRHILTSLKTTRSSISPEERRRLQRIYREFVVGRDGNLPDGQAGNEIGGRTSLM